jgi:hypothetical protein
MVWPATVGSYVAEGRCVERRTLAGPSNVVQWVLSGGP